MKAISTQPTDVKHLFTNYEFVIPAFQRPYSWVDKDQCQVLWDDLIEFYESNQNSASKWFLGSIVLCKNSSTDEKSESDDVRYVVDGQQQLTTLFILLSAIKNKFNTYKGLLDILRPKDELAGEMEPRARIRSCVPEDGAFADLLNQFACENDPVIDKKLFKSNFARNFDFFRAQLKDWIGQVDSRGTSGDAYKNGFVKFLLNRVEILCIECEDEEDAFRVFEVVNDRGMELSPVQIVKPRLMKDLNENERSVFLEDWGRWTNPEEKKEDNTPLISFLFQVLKEIRSVGTRGVPDYQKTSLNKFFKNESLGNVQNDINKLFAIHKWNPPDELLVLMEILERISSKTYKVPLYAYLYIRGKMTQKNGSFSLAKSEEQKAVKFCRDFVRFLYGLSLVERTARDDIRKPCYDLVKWVLDKKSPYKLSLGKEDLKKIKSRLETDFEKEDCYKHGLGTGMMLLASYLFAKKGKGRMEKLAALLRMGFEREHICPRKSGYAWAGAWNEEVHGELVNSIGNLIPLEKEINIDARNNAFTVKRDGERGRGAFRDQKAAVGYRKSISPEAYDYLGKHGDEWSVEDVRTFAKKKCLLILKFLTDNPECAKCQFQG